MEGRATYHGGAEEEGQSARPLELVLEQEALPEVRLAPLHGDNS